MPAVKKSIERKFWRGLRRAFQRLIDRIKNGNGSPKTIVREIREFVNSPEFDQQVEYTVSNMVRTERKDSAKSWQIPSGHGSHGMMLRSLIRKEMAGPVGKRVQEIILENTHYIKSVPQEWAEYIVRYALNAAIDGERAESIEEKLRAIMPDKIQSKLKMIARTECAKANAAIVQARAEMCGIRAYIWRCVKDERSRGSHRAMDGVLVFYDDPPDPEALFPVGTGKYGRGKPAPSYGNYHAGNTFNCRCYQQPVVDIRFLPDSIRVHDHGKIVVMTRAQIAKKYGKIA